MSSPRSLPKVAAQLGREVDFAERKTEGERENFVRIEPSITIKPPLRKGRLDNSSTAQLLRNFSVPLPSLGKALCYLALIVHWYSLRTTLSQAPFVELLGNSWTHSLSEGGYGVGPDKTGALRAKLRRLSR